MSQRVYKHSAFILIPAALIALFFVEWRFSVGILIGGLIGIGNFKGLVWSAKATLGAAGTTVQLVLLSILKFFMVIAVLLILMLLGMINVFGLLIGFMMVLFIVVIEGLRASKEEAST
ncbi:ATP synthase subunit I [Thermodesulfovibrionales bacterium]|nr:ATP synthase subunit I [Thermodesulfovibrionales bacterium]MCL0083455.1 ATP synthase subunit I [Thermodesulfovibrionales bacterium]